MIKYYTLLSASLGRHLDITMEEFKDFLISVKSALDSLAQEITIVFCMVNPRRTFNLIDFINNLQKKDAKLANNIKQLCQEDGWFAYFLKLRNQATHSGKIVPISYLELKMVRDMKVKAIFKKIEGEIPDIPEEKLNKQPPAEKDNAIQDVGFFLPDNPEESDNSKVTHSRKIKFKKYHADLSQRINLLFTECYREMYNEINQMENSFSKKKCQKIGCAVRNCRFKNRPHQE